MSKPTWNSINSRIEAPKLQSYADAFKPMQNWAQRMSDIENKKNEINEQRAFLTERENIKNQWSKDAAALVAAARKKENKQLFDFRNDELTEKTRHDKRTEEIAKKVASDTASYHTNSLGIQQAGVDFRKKIHKEELEEKKEMRRQMGQFTMPTIPRKELPQMKDLDLTNDSELTSMQSGRDKYFSQLPVGLQNAYLANDTGAINSFLKQKPGSSTKSAKRNWRQRAEDYKSGKIINRVDRSIDQQSKPEEIGGRASKSLNTAGASSYLTGKTNNIKTKKVESESKDYGKILEQIRAQDKKIKTRREKLTSEYDAKKEKYSKRKGDIDYPAYYQALNAKAQEARKLAMTHPSRATEALYKSFEYEADKINKIIEKQQKIKLEADENMKEIAKNRDEDKEANASFAYQEYVKQQNKNGKKVESYSYWRRKYYEGKNEKDK